jgi:hypothetical protein
VEAFNVTGTVAGPDVTRERQFVYIPGRAVTSGASTGCATGRYETRFSPRSLFLLVDAGVTAPALYCRGPGS